ncbi:MAG TPA: alanine--tRNA ligase, partial [Dehalococcoidia bacterium]|nr:alanine--tRNA ligase [Dehalococcoidia bacterium]
NGVGCGKPDCKPGCDCGRFCEIWNLVFTQYNQDSNGKRTPLLKPNIDTGMGLERTAAVIQGVSSVYDTDIFVPLRNTICDSAGVTYGKDASIDKAVRIVAEHSRGIAFLIADGVLPSNEGRGYVLRRILRRASFFGRRLGIDRPFLSMVAGVVIDNMGQVYPELVANQELVREIIKVEEDKFENTLDAGINLVERAIDEAVSQQRSYISGGEVFRFWDTYGFHPELTAEIARERGLAVDHDGFKAEMEKQRERARAVQKFAHPAGAKSTETVGQSTVRHIPHPTSFVGYEKLKATSRVSYILSQESGQPITSAAEGHKVAVVLEETPFYGEKGGQVGDTGKIAVDSNLVKVTNTVWSPYGSLAEGAVVHLGEVIKGTLTVGDIVEAEVDASRRLDIARNHTATHLLQMALREVLGSHVYQRGSLVHPEGFRFDFSHLSAIGKQQLDDIQSIVNEKIRQNLPVRSKVIPYRQAIEEGAIAVFDEKYGEMVRVIAIGEPPISAELCGGTHVTSSGEIGFFVITSESSIGTGLRRIEAATGKGAECFIRQQLGVLEAVSKELKSTPAEMVDKVRAVLAELTWERKRLA